eukprot:SAG31_NODE_2071_length_6515_cov_2.490804_1_plen_128_part_00
MLEASHPEIITSMLPFASRYEIKENGTVVSKQSKVTFWSPHPSATESFVKVFCRHQDAAPSARATMLSDAYGMKRLLFKSASSEPYSALLPQVFLDLMEQDSSSEFAVYCRRFVTVSVMPAIEEMRV